MPDHWYNAVISQIAIVIFIHRNALNVLGTPRNATNATDVFLRSDRMSAVFVAYNAYVASVALNGQTATTDVQ